MNGPKGITKKNLKKFRDVVADLVVKIYDWKQDDLDYQWESAWSYGIDLRDAIDRILRSGKKVKRGHR